MIDSRKVATSCTPRRFVTPIFVLKEKSGPDFSAGVIRMVYCIRINRRIWPLYEGHYKSGRYPFYDPICKHNK